MGRKWRMAGWPTLCTTAVLGLTVLANAINGALPDSMCALYPPRLPCLLPGSVRKRGLQLGAPALMGRVARRYTALGQTFGLSPTQLTLFNTASLLMSVRPCCPLEGAGCCMGDSCACRNL